MSEKRSDCRVRVLKAGTIAFGGAATNCIAPKKLYRNFNDIRVRSFILNGAPVSIRPSFIPSAASTSSNFGLPASAKP